MEPLFVVFAVIALFVVLNALRKGDLALVKISGYKRIKDWLREKHGVSFRKEGGEKEETIRTRLKLILDSEKSRVRNDKKLKGFETIVENQDYSFLVE